MERVGRQMGKKYQRGVWGGGPETTKTNMDINSHGGSVSESRKATEKTAAGVFVTAQQGLRPTNYGEAREGGRDRVGDGGGAARLSRVSSEALWLALLAGSAQGPLG